MKKYVGISFLVFLMLLLASCSKPIENMSVDELLQTGEKYLADMKYEKAIVYFEHLIEIEPMNPRGYISVAKVYSAMGDQEKAVAVLSDGLKVFVEDPEVFIKMLEQLIEVEKENPDWYKKLAGMFIRVGDWEKVDRILNEGISEESMSEEGKISLRELLEGKTFIDEIMQYCSESNYTSVVEIMNSEKYDTVLKFVDTMNIFDFEIDDGRLTVWKFGMDYFGAFRKVEISDSDLNGRSSEQLQYLGERQAVDRGHYVGYIVNARDGVMFDMKDGDPTFNHGHYVSFGMYNWVFHQDY